MGKMLLLLAATALLLPSNVRADSSVNFFFRGGTLVVTDNGLSLTSPFTILTGFGGPPLSGPDLGTVSFTTAPLQSGTPEAGVFLPGGTFTVTGSGNSGVPAGVLFSGTFNQRSGWTTYTLPDGSFHHVLHGVLDGTWMGTTPLTNIPMVFTDDTPSPSFSSPGQYLHGSVLFPISVPEPASLSFLIMGAVGLAGAVVAKSKS
ncbi:MAG TPA: PEP-CTERM sorting domain-containing protein [Terriglobales bacterium]|jgi:hypothetical protein|nr:PEP-CTERM sorting domain-containing protein [Terriglobales bacterium]